MNTPYDPRYAAGLRRGSDSRTPLASGKDSAKDPAADAADAAADAAVDAASSPTAARKDEHLDVTLRHEVGFRDTTSLFEGVRFQHNCVPELDTAAIDTSTWLFGKRLRVPLILAAMTGGTARAGRVNRALASVAQTFGCAMGLGSQRAMIEEPSLVETYRVRDVAPDILLLANLGVVQARETCSSDVQRLVQSVGADALCVHMNPAQEIVQAEGDRDFRGGLQTFERLVRELAVPVIAKETGCGIGYEAACLLYETGVRAVDVSGAGGTSWVAVEARRARAGDGRAAALWQVLREWGVPTAVSVVFARKAGMAHVIATGGVRSGLDAAKAMALGACAAGIARPALQAFERDGEDGVLRLLQQIEEQLRAVMLLVGARNVVQLQRCAVALSTEFREWLEVVQR